MSSAGTFSADITKWVMAVQIDLDQLVRKIALDAYAGLILRSPVDTGRFRASWRISVGSIDSSVEPDRGTAPSQYKGMGGSVPPDSAEMAYALGKIASAQFGDMIIYLTNSLDYAQELEDGYSQQAPAGVLALTFIEIVNKLNNAIRQMQGY